MPPLEAGRAELSGLARYDAYIFDLDGTVLLGETLLATTGETISRLRQLGRRTIFLSKNPTGSRQGYAARLTGLGLPTGADEIVLSSQVMADFLRRRLPTARLFVIGEPALVEELSTAGFALTDGAAETDAVIASFDRTFTYRKLQIAFDAIGAGARFFATYADRFRPAPGGGEPDAAAIIAAIEACTNTRVEAVVGKPSAHVAGVSQHIALGALVSRSVSLHRHAFGSGLRFRPLGQR